MRGKFSLISDPSLTILSIYPSFLIPIPSYPLDGTQIWYTGIGRPLTVNRRPSWLG